MSIPRARAKSLEDVKKQFRADKEGFIRKYSKAEIIMGNSEAIEFINEILNNHYNNRFSKEDK